MSSLFSLHCLARASRASAFVGSFLVGPGTIALVYGFMGSENPGGRLDRAAIVWHVGYDTRDGCTVDVAQRLRCGSGGASCFSLDRGHFGGYPPALDAVVDGWVYAGTLVIGTGMVHLFVAHLLQGILVQNRWMILSSYLSVLCFFAVVGTSSFGGDRVLQNVNFACHSFLYILLCSTNTIMLRSEAGVWSSQLAYLLHAATMLALLLVLSSFSLVGAAFGQQMPCDAQYMASGLLSITQQLFLAVYSASVVSMFRNSGGVGDDEWARLCHPAEHDESAVPLGVPEAWLATQPAERESELFIGKQPPDQFLYGPTPAGRCGSGPSPAGSVDATDCLHAPPRQ